MRRNLALVSVVLFVCLQLRAEGYNYYGPSHSFSIVGEYGNTSLKNGSFNDLGSKVRDYSVGMEYTYRFNRNWGFVTGAGWRKYNSTISVGDFLKEQTAAKGYFAEPSTDRNGNAYELRFSGDQSEKYSINYIEVPLKVRFFIPTTSWLEFFVGAGVSGGYNFKESAAITEGTYDRSVFFTDKNILVDDNPALGLGTKIADFYNPASRRFNQFNFSALGEVGFSLHATKNLSFDLGINAVYGLIDARQYKTTLGNIDSYSGVIHTQMVDKVTPFTASIKAGITFRFGRKSNKKADAFVDQKVEQFIPEPVTTAKVDTPKTSVVVVPPVIIQQPTTVVAPQSSSKQQHASVQSSTLLSQDTLKNSYSKGEEASATSLKQYCVVVGSFFTKADAEVLGRRFKAGGFNVTILSKGVHHRVVIDSYDTMWAAMRRLPGIRQRYAIYDIWVYDQKSRF